MTKTKKRQVTELDRVYLLKIVIYLILGSFWIKISSQTTNWQVPIPVGFIAGIVLASRDKFQIDRKLEYAILLMAMFIGFWLPIGIKISF